MKAGELRQTVIDTESKYGIPSGFLQAVAEEQGGWRHQNNITPSRTQQKSNIKLNSVLEDVDMSGERLGRKMKQFNGAFPLAVSAFMFGNAATEKAVTDGFTEAQTNQVFSVVHRAAKLNGDEVTDELLAPLKNVIGTPTQNFSGIAKAKPPKVPLRLTEGDNGKYTVNDPRLNAIMQLESGGDPDAISPTGAKGLFQFTKGTGREYGLLSKGADYRSDPQKALDAMQKLTSHNIRGLRKAKLPVTDATVYLAHQQGLTGAKVIIAAAESGDELPKNIRRNLDLNGGLGLSAEQFLNKWTTKVNSKLNSPVAEEVPQSIKIPDVDVAESDTPAPKVVNYPTQPLVQNRADVTPRAEGAPMGFIEAQPPQEIKRFEEGAPSEQLLSALTEKVPPAQLPERRLTDAFTEATPTNFDKLKVANVEGTNWEAHIRKAFGGKAPRLKMPEHTRQAIKGVLKG